MDRRVSAGAGFLKMLAVQSIREKTLMMDTQATLYHTPLHIETMGKIFERVLRERWGSLRQTRKAGHLCSTAAARPEVIISCR
ncbi:MAG TPA: hypothetical protein DEF05_10470 [Erwinia sp.]|nr:hypothetical protein [Erwinia sp.]